MFDIAGFEFLRLHQQPPDGTLLPAFASPDAAKEALRDPDGSVVMREALGVPDDARLVVDYSPEADKPGWRQGQVVYGDGTVELFEVGIAPPSPITEWTARALGWVGLSLSPQTRIEPRRWAPAEG
jgi:hypothetical protein